MSLVEVRNFSYTYPGEEKPSLTNINLVIEQGELVIIAGPSGSGKSTLGKALAGFLFQEENPEFTGKIIVNQTDMTEVPLFQSSERVAYVQQNPEDHFCTLSVLDEIAFALENACLPSDIIDQRINSVLEVVKGTDLKNRDLASLSGGEKQKVAIASILAIEPDVLVLDEPTSNLDPVATENIFSTLYKLRKLKDLTVIIIEHKLSQLKAYNPRLFLMKDGKIRTKTCLNDYALETAYIQNNKIRINSQSNQYSSPLVNLSNVSVCLGNQEILRDISFQLFPGEFVALMGPNGSGKSTLLETIMGFHKPDHGALFCFGKNITHTKISTLVSDIGYIFQNPDHQLFTQSVWDEGTFILKNLNLLSNKNELSAQTLLTEMGLKDRLNDHPHRLSFGEKRRLNLAAVILHKPKLLLVDEFLIGQDMENAHKWMRTLKTLTSYGHTILFVNHHSGLTQTYCDRVLFLDSGKLILDKPIETAFKSLDKKGYWAFIPKNQKIGMYA